MTSNLQQFQSRYDELHSEYMAYRKQTELGNKEMATLCKTLHQTIDTLTAKQRHFTKDLLLSLSSLRSLEGAKTVGMEGGNGMNAMNAMNGNGNGMINDDLDAMNSM